MLGATTVGALTHPVSIPPRPEELTKNALRDWKTGVELVRTCVATHDTATCAIYSFNAASELTLIVSPFKVVFLLRLCISELQAMG
jgi:hypothetical protein